MVERVMATNLYGGSNPRGPAVRDWIRDIDPNVVLISELGRMTDDLRPIGRVVHGSQNDVGILVCKGKVDEANVVKLTDHIHRNDRPLFWRARYYVRVRINDRVYYCTHGNAAIKNDQNGYLDNRGAEVWKEGMKKLRAAVERDIDKGYAVRVGGDFNMGESRPPIQHTPNDMFDDLGLNYMRHNVDWIAWDPRYDSVENKRVIGKAPGADAHHTLILTLDEKESHKPSPDRTGSGGRNKSLLEIFTLPSGGVREQKLGEELEQIRKDFSPDLIAVQGTRRKLDTLKGLDGYGVAMDRSKQHHAVLFKRATFRPIGAFEVKAQDDWILVSDLEHRASGTHVVMVTSNLDVKGEKGRGELRKFANIVKEAGARGRLAFWSGRFDLNVDNARVLTEAGLESVFAELDKDIRTKDFVGSFTGDKRVAAKLGRRPSVLGRTMVRATYTLSTLRQPDTTRDDTGTPTKTPDPDDPEQPRQRFQKDEGASIDHTDCCGGYSE